MLSIRLWASRILLLLLSALLYVPADSQKIPAIQEDARLRFVSPEEGEGLVWVAWELRRGLDSKPDCSHFVNLIYARAGLDYEYATTGAIFDGIDAFRRVRNPQAGDLVAWRGHVGLVVDPDEHSFYSSVRSGFAIEDYRSDYWISRGHPRFYRYLIDEIHSGRLAAHLRTMPLVVPRTYSTFADRSLSEGEPEFHATNSPLRGDNTTAKSSVGDTEISDAIFVSAHDRPSKDEIRAAVIRLADANGEGDFQLPVLRSSQAIVVAEQVTVGDLHIDDRYGWAELESKEKASSQCLQHGLGKASARWRVTLRREERGWILLAPRNRIYLRRRIASRALAQRVGRTGAASTVERPGAQTSCEDTQ